MSDHTDETSEALAHEGEVDHLYRDWFLDYASYVILDRAIPAAHDGLKPVQRRLLHALAELDDGRFNKAANIIGHTMRYHPHGDMAIGDALVKLAQKSFLIETQGNWGNPLTGDRAAAPRYIEARLAPLAKDILFNPELTRWQPSYDGRQKEPVLLPVKFPVLLHQGVEGIAVGLSTRILPHNFIELVRESIAILKGHEPRLLPDFPGGGLCDASDYRDGRRGGKVRLRARCQVLDPKTIAITELPYGVTTQGLIDSILSANDKGKIKIKKIEDNTAEGVSILIRLASGVSVDLTLQALYAFTDCEVSVAPQFCVIESGRPHFGDVRSYLRATTLKTKEVLRQELTCEREKLRQKIHQARLERVFIEEKLYRKLERADTWEAGLKAIHKGLAPFQERFLREVSDEDVERLTEIRIKRISRFDQEKAAEELAKLEERLKQVEHHLEHLVAYAIKYFRYLEKSYGKGRERRTEITTFDRVEARVAEVVKQKLYIDRAGGFIGTGLRKEELLFECGSTADVLTIRADGTYVVNRVGEKVFVGKNPLYVGLFERQNERCIFHLIYRDGRGGSAYAKRCAILVATRDKEYNLTRGTPASRVLYLSVNPNGESETVRLLLEPALRLRKTEITWDFSEMAVKGRSAAGVIATKHKVKKVVQQVRGASTLAAQRLWFDRDSGTLCGEEKGAYLGMFGGDESLLVIYESGSCEVMPFRSEHRFGEKVREVAVWKEGLTLSVVYTDGERKAVFAKRMALEGGEERRDFVTRHPNTRLWVVTLREKAAVRLDFTGRGQEPLTVDIAAEVEFRTLRALGQKLSEGTVRRAVLI